ncbi:16273_t:CDS:2, partial [Funneliformis geosporum]
MVKLEGRWNLVSSYVRATYKVLDKETGKEYSVKGNVIGQKVLSIFGDEVVFEEGEYIKRLTAKYEPVTGATSNFHVTTSLGRKFWLIRVQLVSFTKIELKDVACLTGHRGILCCDSIGRHGKTRLPTKLYDFDSKEIVRTEDKEDNYAILSHSVEKEGDIDKSIEKAGKVCEDLKKEIKQEMRKMSGYYSNSTFTLIAINDKLEGLLSKHTIFMFDDDTIDGASESSHQSNKTSFVIELEKALEMVTKERKVTVAKDIFYSVL